jgi:hypothetical protein
MSWCRSLSFYYRPSHPGNKLWNNNIKRQPPQFRLRVWHWNGCNQEQTEWVTPPAFLADLPLREIPLLERGLKNDSVSLIRFLTPEGRDRDMALALKGARDFIYFVSKRGTTGGAFDLDSQTQEKISRVRGKGVERKVPQPRMAGGGRQPPQLLHRTKSIKPFYPQEINLWAIGSRLLPADNQRKARGRNEGSLEAYHRG